MASDHHSRKHGSAQRVGFCGRDQPYGPWHGSARILRANGLHNQRASGLKADDCRTGLSRRDALGTAGGGVVGRTAVSAAVLARLVLSWRRPVATAVER
ncbi:hypothetical protein DF3PA_50039 [Candidatus Defluviicoccus seviourii]|uniref:Uncharacterized protein n=2 Tax=root TaxID=1 RepID=A0A564WFZ6_9PROT|nr:hypothetical protein DF3PB_430010 [uncultured Defluviicoccus sp.]VUX47392.1 hypothetical protein DF3PA_50039 [Candidatus Defluviicoccus seviourii]